VRFGLLGTGYWAAETHAAALVAAPGTELAAVWGRDPAKAASVADRYGIRPYDDVDELIAAVDAVAIALPPQVQAPLAARAARAGKHLFLDKPLALTVAAADEVVAAVGDGQRAEAVAAQQVDRAGGRVVGQHRHHPGGHDLFDGAGH